MNNNLQLFYLSGLLHDIGKFYQRADRGLNQSELLDESSKKIADYICPLNEKGNYAYQHVIWSYDFVHKYADKVFNNLGLTVNVFDENQDKVNHLINLIAYHHKPNTIDQAFIQLADWWASGMDRTQGRDYQVNEVEKEKVGFKEKTILNIFSHVQMHDKVGDASYFVIQDFNLNELKSAKHNANSAEKYKALWQQFIAEFEKLPLDSLTNFNYSLTHLLKKYTWLIPASTIDFPDNSLFDHLKLTAAFAQILYSYRQNNSNAFIYENNRLTLTDNHYPVCMGCADLSGIQNFIYNISSKHAAKSVKGRSFYLQLLVETVQHELMQKLGLQPGHFIYSSGGKMFFLFANTTENHKKLNEIHKACESFLWNQYKGTLSLHIASANFRYNNKVKEIEIEQSGSGDLGLLWQTVTEKVSKQKVKKFASVYTANFDQLFKPHEVGGTENICAVTGEELHAKNRVNIDTDDDGDKFISKTVHTQILIGKALKGGVITLLTNNKQFTPGVKLDHVFDDILPFGFKAAIINEDELNGINSADHVICIKTITADNNSFVRQLKGNDIRYGFRLYGGYDAPVKSETDEYKTFEDLAGKDGYNKLGVLRMDVDFLGQLFIKGFDSQHKTFSAYATLSGMLDWFFSGYLNTVRSKSEFADDVQIIYAGGDDLFAVGRWEKIVGFAEQVNLAFKSFTGRNNITVSGGITIVDAKFPIAKAADLAGDAEDKAKEHVMDGNEKNAITLFNVALNWDEEFSEVKAWESKLTQWLQNGTITKGLLMKFFDYYEIYKTDKSDNSWKWNLMYQMSRRLKAIKETDREKRLALEELQKYWMSHIGSGKTPMDNFMVACRWAELRNRVKQN